MSIISRCVIIDNIHNTDIKYLISFTNFSIDLVSSYGIPRNHIIGAISGTSLKCRDYTVIPIPSAHEELHENGNYMELGYKIIRDEISLYHGGDCCLYDGLSDYLYSTNPTQKFHKFVPGEHFIYIKEKLVLLTSFFI